MSNKTALWAVVDAIERAWACGALDIEDRDADVLHTRALRNIHAIEKESIRRRKNRSIPQSRRRIADGHDAAKGSSNIEKLDNVLDAETIRDFGSMMVSPPD